MIKGYVRCFIQRYDTFTILKVHFHLISVFQCYTLFLPADDDAHLVLVSLPGDVSIDLESWFVSQVVEMTKPENSGGLKNEIKLPKEISDETHKYSGGSLQVSISKGDEGHELRGSLDLFAHQVYENIVKNIGDKNSDGENAFDLCFTGPHGKESRVIYDVITLNEFEDKLQHKHMLKKEHLTPLETTFEQSIIAAKKILEEMENFQRHETRMKHTADSTNARIRFFSYLSVIILVSVTYFQITYLKGYFKKKKIL